MRYYKVNVLSIILLGVVSLIRMISENPVLEMGQIVLLNLVFTSIILGTLFGYSFIRKTKLPQVFAWGDILFLIIAILCFSPLNFILFIIVSSFTGILFYVFRSYILKTKLIPFAGIMAAVLAVVVCIDLFSNYSSYSDSWLNAFLVQ